MKYLKLFEELNRIVVNSEEKSKIKKIVIKATSLINDNRFSSGINERHTVEYDLVELKTIIKNKEYDIISHFNNGYKMVDNCLAQLSKLRGVEIIFDRKDNCFKTKSGKALCTINIISDKEMLDKTKGRNPCFTNRSIKVYINYKNEDLYNDSNKKPKYNFSDYIQIWDFTGGNIYLPVDSFRKVKEKELNTDIFSVVFHEFTHAKDPNAWLGDKNYKTPDQIKSGEKGIYASSVLEIQTMCNNLLEILAYYFERTWRGDTDGGGLNYNLNKDEIIKNFIPTIDEVRDFINGKIDNLSDNAIKQLSGTNKTTKFIKAIIVFISEIKKEAPDKMKFVQEWMKSDFTKLIETYNRKVTEINKKKPKDSQIQLIDSSRFII